MKQKSTARISLADLSPEDREVLQEFARGETQLAVVSKDGKTVELPEPVAQVFRRVAEAARMNEYGMATSESGELTTQQAANYLGVSQQHLVDLLEAGQIPFHRVGAHRRVKRTDVFAYEICRDAERSEALRNSTRELVELGLYDRILPQETD